MLGVSYVMTFYVDACALEYFQFHPRSIGRSVGRSVGQSVCRSRHYFSALWCRDKNSLPLPLFFGAGMHEVCASPYARKKGTGDEAGHLILTYIMPALCFDTPKMLYKC